MGANIARRAQAGFTLVEILIAMAIFAVMATMAYGGLSSIISTHDSIDAALGQSKTLQMSLWRVQRDVEQIVARPIRDNFGDGQPAVVGSSTVGLSFTHTGWANPLGEPRSTLQRVNYSLDNDHNFVRSYWYVLDQAQDSRPTQTTLLEHVTSMEWRFMDSNRQWQDRWPPDADNDALDSATQAAQAASAEGATQAVGSTRLPLAIELILNTEQWGELRLMFLVPGAQS